MAEFALRPMEPADGPAIDALMRSEAPTTAVALTTRYLVDVHQALVALRPSVFGVVATSPEGGGIVGVATAYTDEVIAGADPIPAIHLENLKVRHDVRRQGLGSRLAAWRIEEARRRIGGEGVVVTAIDATNTASIATARHWSSQVLGPVRVVVARVAGTPPRLRGLVARPVRDSDLEAVVAGAAAFHASFELAPPFTVAGLATLLRPVAAIGPLRQYRVAVTDAGDIVAGVLVTERFRLMEDHLDRVPRPLELLARIVPVFPPGRTIRTVELGLAWHAPGRADALRGLWDAIRHEWRDRATHVVAQPDPRSSVMAAFHVGPTLVPRVRLVVPVRSTVAIDERRPVCLWR